MSRLTSLLLCFAAAGVPAAVVWAWLAEPSLWVVSDGKLFLTEANAGGQFEVVVAFAAIGVVLSFVFGIITERLARPNQWQTVLALALVALAAAFICWQLGILLGPPAPSEVPGLESGDKVPAQLKVDAVAPFLAWPLGAVLGYTLSFYLGSDGLASDDQEPISADEISA
ncbi:MAG TPA: hypothetical protein PLQ19_02950 [Aeromicrobium sp.]|nr:hypothetical protein [Aeromicrobium sp.]